MGPARGPRSALRLRGRRHRHLSASVEHERGLAGDRRAAAGLSEVRVGFFDGLNWKYKKNKFQWFWSKQKNIYNQVTQATINYVVDAYMLSIFPKVEQLTGSDEKVIHFKRIITSKNELFKEHL